MKYLRSIFVFSFFIIGFAQIFAFGAKESNSSEEKKITVYAYKSFVSSYGPGLQIAEIFKTKTGYEIEYVICKEGVENRAIVEGKNTSADILLGIDNHLIEKVRKANILLPYKPKNHTLVSKDVIISDDWLLTPFDYGYIAFMYDTKAKIIPPKNFKDLTKDEYKGKFVLIDPRSSTTGLAMVPWSRAVFGDNYLDFWKNFKKNVFTMTPSWSASYDLFTRGEAPFAISYTTSLAYHVLNDKTDRYQPIIFDDGNIMQIEGMGISSYTKHLEGAKLFIEFMLTEEAQSIIPENQFMFPANSKVQLPASYKDVPKPVKALRIPTEDLTVYTNAVIDAIQK